MCVTYWFAIVYLILYSMYHDVFPLWWWLWSKRNHFNLVQCFSVYGFILKSTVSVCWFYCGGADSWGVDRNAADPEFRPVTAQQWQTDFNTWVRQLTHTHTKLNLEPRFDKCYSVQRSRTTLAIAPSNFYKLPEWRDAVMPKYCGSSSVPLQV